MTAVRAIGWLLMSCLAGPAADQTRLKPDEKIVFYPGNARRIPGEAAWRVEIHGCVYEPEKRGVLMAALRVALDLKDVAMTPSEEKQFNERARLFLVDHERGKKIFVRFGLEPLAVGKSKADGTFFGEVRLSGDDIGESPCVTFDAALPPGEGRSFRGQAFKLEQTGLSVISDIDDTIKITEVRDRHALLRNTFFREFTPVPGMAELYQTLARSNRAQFHYLSAGPWQLCEPLVEFANTHGFPQGTFALKEFRWKNRTFLSLFASPEKYKPAVIEPLLKRFPQRRFILIGDSGERDPEIFAALARKYPRQIAGIYIRDVTGEPASAARYTKTFLGVPTGLWQVFATPDELKPFLETPPSQR